MMEETRTYAAKPESMPECQAFLASVCESPKPQIIMDEIVSNIVRCSGATSFSVTLGQRDPEGLVAMTFVDDGMAFDPTREIAEPDVSAKLEDRKIGGLGMFMVRKMSQSVSYARENGRNVLKVTL